MENILHPTKGSNQFKTKRRFLGLKVKAWYEIIFLLAIITFAAIVGRYSVLMSKHMSWKPVQVYASIWKEPALAPIKERTEVIAMIKKVWGQDADTGLGIARCESGYRINAENHNTNGTVDQGVFQINSVHGMPDMYNGTANIAYAYGMFKDQGTGPWDSSKGCWGN